jgi:hypothetical protein
MNNPGYTPPQPPPVVDPPPYQFLAFTGGCFFAVALVMGVGTALLWWYVTTEAERLRNDPGFAGFGLAILGLGAFVALIVVASIIGTAAGAATVVRYKRARRFPVHAIIGGIMLGIAFMYGSWGYIQWKLLNPAPPAPAAAGWTPPFSAAIPPQVSSRAANNPPSQTAQPPPQTRNPQSVQSGTPALERPPRPTVEQIQQYQRQAEQEAPPLLGEWLYPNARVIPFTPRPDDTVSYRYIGLQTTDDLQSVLQFYTGKTTVGGETGGVYKFEGKRPGDGRDCSITVRTYNNTVFIRFDTR